MSYVSSSAALKWLLARRSHFVVAIYPTVHSQLQVAELSRRLLQNVRVGV